MAWGRRDPLAATRRENTADRMRRQREAMTPAEVEAAMVKLARDHLAGGQDVSLDDFRRANLPMGTVRDLYERVKTRIKYGARE
jgi:hypothetical protein